MSLNLIDFNVFPALRAQLLPRKNNVNKQRKMRGRGRRLGGWVGERTYLVKFTFTRRKTQD